MLYDNDNEMSLINLTTMKTTFRFLFNYDLFSGGFFGLGHVPRRLLKQDYLFLHVGCPSCGPTHTVVSGFVKQGDHLTMPGWSKPHTHSNPTNLALFRHKITPYRFNQGGSYYCRGLKWEQGG